MSVEKDIAFQWPVEAQIAYELARKWPGSAIIPNKVGKDGKKDFKVLRPLAVEVKCDYKGKETRNLFMEVYNCYLKQPSGLAATEAWRWVHYIPSDATAYVYCPKTMLKWVTTQKDYPLVKGAGDKNSDGYPVPVTTIAALSFVDSLPMMI